MLKLSIALLFIMTAVIKARLAGDRIDLLAAVACSAFTVPVAVISEPFDLAASAVIACTAVSAFTDISSGYIYDAAIALGAVFIGLSAICNRTLPEACAGGAVALALSGGLHVLTSRRGLGLGDVKLLAVTGAGLGAGAALVVFGAAFVAGAVAMLFGVALRRLQLRQQVPFAPYIAIATIAVAAFHLPR